MMDAAWVWTELMLKIWGVTDDPQPFPTGIRR